jgi:hypothetical protein
MLRRNDYPSHDDLIQIDWHHAGVFQNPAGSARSAYLGGSSAPDTYFDGIDHVLGAGDSVGTYNTYRGIVNNHYNNQGSQLIIRDVFVDYDTNAMLATVTYTVEVAPGETITNPSDMKLRSAAYEDSLFSCCEPVTGNNIWNHIGRALGTVTNLTVTTSGQTQDYVGTFAINPAWNLDNMSVVAFAERDSNKKVEQAGEACRQHGVLVADVGGTVVSSATPVDFDVELTYTGCIDDDVTVTLDKSGLPGDWDALIVVGANTYPSTVTFPGMTVNQVQPYAIRVIPGASAALAFVSATSAPASAPGTGATHEYGVFANTPAILYVNDDNGGVSQVQYETAITNSGHFYYTYDVDLLGEPGASLIAGFDAIIWNTGFSSGNTITPTMQANLITYLDGGGKLFLSSQGILNQYGTAPVFIKNYLRVLSMLQDRQALTCNGVPGDPIGDGLSFTLSGPFPDFADLVTPNTGASVWLVGHLGDVAVHYDSGTFQTVFMSPAFELVPAGDQTTVMTRVLTWFFPGGATDVPANAVTEPIRLSLRQNAPNPFSDETSVRFAVPEAGTVSLDVFDVTGRRVARLVDGLLPAGSHVARWDGRDAAGSRVASGVYLLKLSAGGESVARQVVLTR